MRNDMREIKESKPETPLQEKVDQTTPLSAFPKLKDIILDSLGGIEKLNELIACDNNSPLWAQYQLTPDRQNELWGAYLSQVTQHLFGLVKQAKRDGAENLI